MNRSRSHNALLTVIALLLAMQVWMGISSQAVFANETQAAGDPPTFPNASKQREEIVAAIRDLTAQVKRTNELLESSTLNVEISNIKDFATVDSEE